MSRKHYEMLARLIRASLLYGWAPEALAEALATELARDNPNFNRARFIQACGIPRPVNG